MSGNYPPGVTGNEPEIQGDSGWEHFMDVVSSDVNRESWTDMDAFVAWKLGVAALKSARSIGAAFPSDTTP